MLSDLCRYLDRQAAREARDAERNGDGPSPAAQAAQAQAEPYESEVRGQAGVTDGWVGCVGAWAQ